MARTSQNSSHLPIESYVNVVERQGGIYTNYPVVVKNSITANSINSSGAQAITSASANSFAVGPAGVTNPVFNVDSSTSSAVAGLDVVGAATGGTVAVKTTDSGSNTSLTVDGKGTGTVGINTVSTTSGLVTVGNSTSKAGLAVNGNVTANSVIIPVLEYVTSPVFAAATFASGTAFPIYTFPNDGTTWKVVNVSLRYTTASSSGTVDVGVSASGTAPSAATTQLTATISTASTANTANNGTIIASPTTIAGGAALVVTSGGTATNLVNLVVTIAMQRLS